MVIRAAKLGLVVQPVPDRIPPSTRWSKLSTWGDGWRHLRFLLCSPKYLFIAPGAVMASLGALTMAGVASISVFGRQWDIHGDQRSLLR